MALLTLPLHLLQAQQFFPLYLLHFLPFLRRGSFVGEGEVLHECLTAAEILDCHLFEVLQPDESLIVRIK